ncbi:hypothetical protein CTEN210_05074 [Chaetoceros tenuissimus]|uniref:PCIF1 WW domain-containing protein n=1 Tax=Chaetoceros tenuissimus TaxID=426638 RepID=A0AAD3CMT9_9STRA|nr:hypothetical protein CTEN210_05074 [Chaetoceros tenuissimus]
MSSNNFNHLDIWDAKAQLNKQNVPQEELASTEKFSSVASEFARFKAMKTLRSKFARLTNQHGQGISPPPLAFDRWLARSSLQRVLDNNSSIDSTTPDDIEIEIGSTIAHREPVIPCYLKNMDTGGEQNVQPEFIADLSRTYSKKTAMLIAEQITTSSLLAAEKHDAIFHSSSTASSSADNDVKQKIKAMLKATKRSAKKVMESTTSTADQWLELEQAAEALRDYAALKAAMSTNCSADEMKVHKVMSKSGHVVLLSAYSLDGNEKKFVKPYMTINKQHYDKLVELHLRATNSTQEEVDEKIFCILCRYEGIKGVGSQCALPGAVFESLEKYLGNTIECFASPLNCRFQNYYSAFPALEQHFGSLGSFFSSYSDIKYGSFEANPPFVPEIMTFMEEAIHSLLEDKSKGPLSFLIIVPDWGGTNSTAEVCMNSKFNRASTCISASQHVFADGAQHRVSERWRPSSWDTAVILLQNDRGKSKWPMTADQLSEAITSSFSRSKNTGGPEKNDEDVYAWEARGIKKGGRQGKNIPIKRKSKNGHTDFKNTQVKKKKF